MDDTTTTILYIVLIVLIVVFCVLFYSWLYGPYKGMTKEEKQQPKADKRRRHRMAMVTIFFTDQTYSLIQVDIDKQKGKLTVEDFDYELPSMPMKVQGWWPFKARTLKAAIFKDAHYNIDFTEGDSRPVNINYELDDESNYIHPMTYKAMVNEKGYEKMLQSIKKKKIGGPDTKWLIIIVAIVAVAGLIIAKMVGLF